MQTRAISPGAMAVYILAAIAPVVLLIIALNRYAFNYPFVDDWHMVELIVKTYEGELAFADFWRAYNGHRLFFWHIIMLPLAYLTHWNHSWEVALNVLVGLGIFAVIVAMLKRIAATAEMPFPYFAIPILSLIVFSLNQWCNWAWGRQVLVFLVVLYAVLGFHILSVPKPGLGRIVVAAILGFIGTFTFASGLVYWPCVLVILLLPAAYGDRVQWKNVALWIAITIVTCILYFYEFEADRTLAHAVPEGADEFSIPSIRNIAMYTLAYLGTSLSYFSGWGLGFRTGLGMALGIAGLLFLIAVHIVFLRRKMPLPAVIPITACALYAIGSGALTAIGRAGVGGINQAGAQRYYTISLLFWIAIVFAILLLMRDAKPIRRYIGIAALMCIAGLSILTTRQGWYTLDEHQGVYTPEVRRMIVENLEEPPPRLKFPIKRSLVRDLELLREYELSIYRPTAEARWREDG